MTVGDEDGRQGHTCGMTTRLTLDLGSPHEAILKGTVGRVGPA